MDSFVSSLSSKLRNTVQSTVSNLNAVTNLLPGNVLCREYEVGEHICSAGPGLLWKVYSATKKSTKEEASLFLFEKRQLDKLSRADKDMIIENVKKGVSQLTRLRHPSILIVQHGLEESRDSLAFATEPVCLSLANVLGGHDNLPSPLPKEISEHQFYDVEIKYGLLSLSEGLAFIHNDVKLLHRNLAPESILISKKGSWKLCGFDFSVPALNPTDFPIYFPFLNVVNSPIKYHQYAMPNPDFMAPEYVTQADEPEPRLSLASDMYSLGALTYALYNKGKLLMPTGGSVGALTAKRFDQIDQLPEKSYECIPDDSRHHVRLLLSSDGTLRPDAHQFSKLAIFEDVLVRTLQYLDALFQWDNLQKSKFYKGLPEIMSQMPLRVKLDRVVPCLTKEFVNPDMVPFVLPNILLVAEEISNEQFEADILNSLIPVFQMKEPIQIAMILMQKMELILNKSKNKPDSIKSHILPMICRTLETNAQQVQELCLTTIPTVVHLIDYPSIKNSILPKVKKLCVETGLLSVRVNCLICIGKIIENLDKWLVLDEVISFLPEIPSKEPAVIMASIGIIQMTMNSSKLGLTKEIIANKVVPYLMPLTIENGLTMDQFNTIMTLLREVIRRVEEEHRVKLEQLNSMREQQSFAVIKYESVPKPSASMDDIFSNRSASAIPAAPTSSTQQQAARPLTLAEKERLAREKSQQKILNAQNPISPSPSSNHISSGSTATARVTPSQPKDLTSTLISSNLANLSLKSAQQHQPNYNIDTESLAGVGNSQHVALNGLPMLGGGPPAAPMLFHQSQQQHPQHQFANAPSSTGLQLQRPLYNQSLANLHTQQSFPAAMSGGSGGSSGMRPMASAWPNQQPATPMSFTSMSAPRPSNNTNGNATVQLSKTDLEEFLK